MDIAILYVKGNKLVIIEGITLRETSWPETVQWSPKGDGNGPTVVGPGERRLIDSCDGRQTDEGAGQRSMRETSRNPEIRTTVTEWRI